MKSYQWLLFDADGTLFDYDSAEASALRNTFRDNNLPYELDYSRTYRRINGEIWRDLELGRITQQTLRTRRFELLFQAIGIRADPGQFSQRYLKNLSERTELIEGAEQLITQLHHKFKIAIITNGLQDVQRPRLAQSSISSFIDCVVISEEIGAAKPDAEIFDAAFELMGQPQRKDVLMVGDSLTSDITGGFRYGLDTCWFNPSGLPTDPTLTIQYEIIDLGQLVEILLPGSTKRTAE